MTRCPHGDLSCPCQDGTAAGCHYEGAERDPCPTMGRGLHCHIEACEWQWSRGDELPPVELCGMFRLGASVAGAEGLGCGLMRFLVAMAVDCQEEAEQQTLDDVEPPRPWVDVVDRQGRL